jgi:predicted metalloprotease with PDZ domain
MLIPHEYVHAWCGKFRRPQGMITEDLHSPKDTRLLWVYEGLTQYLGTLLEVRSGLMSPEAFRWHLRRIVVDARYQDGRAWRSLEDTGASAHVLRAGSPRWGSLRRGQDFYYEGLLLWLEADARIRNLTRGDRSLDDFCRRFFAVEPQGPVPHGYDRDTVVRTLGEVVDDDWDAFIRERVERTHQRFPLTVLDELGLLLQYVNVRPEPPESEREIDRGDLRASLGLDLRRSGTVGTVVLGGPGDLAGLAPGDRIHGVNGFVHDDARLDDAVARSVATGTIDLLVVSGDRYETRTLRYDGGPRHPVLVSDDERVDRLAEIVAPLE